MASDELADRCCWKHCRHDSATIYRGVGLCETHLIRACDESPDSPIARGLIPHLIPPAADAIRRTIELDDLLD